MRRLLWPLSVVVAFGAGVGVAALPRQGGVRTAEVERLQMQVSTLEARLRARETSAARPTVASVASVSPGASRWSDRSVAGGAVDGGWRLGRSERGPGTRAESADAHASPSSGARVTAAPANVQSALERFYSYLDERNGSGPGRWQRMRELADELRAMGPAGAEALMRVLTSGTTSDERRTAAQLLGDMRVGSALPLFQDILDKDSDVLLRRAAASGLRRLDMPEAAPYFQAILANGAEDRYVRMSAAAGLAQLGNPQGVSGLVQIFDEANGDGRGREMAFRALNSLNDDRALPFMRRLVTSDAELSFRLQAIRYVAAQGDRQALAGLQLVMQSPTEQPSIRDAAAQAHAALAARQ